jgi:hypothetical protein
MAGSRVNHSQNASEDCKMVFKSLNYNSRLIKFHNWQPVDFDFIKSKMAEFRVGYCQDSLATIKGLKKQM